MRQTVIIKRYNKMNEIIALKKKKFKGYYSKFDEPQICDYQV